MSTTLGTVRARYELWGNPASARARAEALAVEQSHEFPPELAPAAAAPSRGVVADLEVRGPELAAATVDYPAELAGGEIGQFLVFLFGNCALLPGVRLVGLEVPDALATALGGGPKLGVAGLRRVLHAPTRPLLATALKPVGLGPADFAELAYRLALGGVDVIKDDQGLGNQPWAPFAERVPLVAEAVARANRETGGRSLYLPSFNPPVDEIEPRLRLALDAGAGGFLVVPGTGGPDLVRYLAAHTPDDAVLLSHPAFLGGFTVSPTSGIAPEILFGPIQRLLGADAVIFPSYGGRFTFSEEQCRGIAAGCHEPFAGLAPALPTPGGGMTVERVPELVEFYGRDVLLLIGGALHRGGDPRRAAERFRAAAEAL